MILKRLAVSFALAAAFVSSASADVIYEYTATMESGATFDGTVTLMDDYSRVLDVDGYLKGGQYGNTHLNWVWADGMNFSNTPGTYKTFLMDGSQQTYSYRYFLSFMYDYSNGPKLVLTHGTTDNQVNYEDNVVSGKLALQNAEVPEPTTLALMGLGLLGVAAQRKRKKQS